MKLSALVRVPLIAFIFLFFLFIGSRFSSADAQTNYSTYPTPTISQNINYAAPNTNLDVPKNLHTYTQNVLIETMVAVACQLTGLDPTTPDGRCLGPDPKTGKIGYVDNDGGAIGFMGNMITMLYTPPAHTGQYIQNLASNFGITKTTYAKWDFELPDNPSDNTPAPSTHGTGFEALSPIINIWSAFRDIAYLLFIMVFVVIGVAIMLRLKIDPRTVMTIQNQIPKIIIGLLLVTLSFAIAGFLIDVMWIAIYLFYNVFAGIPGVDVASLSPSNIAGSTPLGAAGSLGGISGIANNGSGAIKDITASILDGPLGGIIGNILGGVIGGSIGGAASGIFGKIGGTLGGVLGAPGGPWGSIAGAVVGKTIGQYAAPIIGGALGFAVGAKPIISTIGGIIAYLIIIIALLWALIRVWFALLMAYIIILLDIVFAPFWIIGGLVPGSKISFTGWLRSVVGNLSAFPATLVMFMLGKTFMDTFTSSGAGKFVPPFIGNPGDTKAFGALIGLGIILTIPGVVKMMRSVFGAPAFELGSIGAAIGAGTAVATGTVKQTAGSIFTYKEGTMPKTGEKGIPALFRRMIR